jgi:hypothetical protein
LFPISALRALGTLRSGRHRDSLGRRRRRRRLDRLGLGRRLLGHHVHADKGEQVDGGGQQHHLQQQRQRVLGHAAERRGVGHQSARVATLRKQRADAGWIGRGREYIIIGVEKNDLNIILDIGNILDIGKTLSKIAYLIIDPI